MSADRFRNIVLCLMIPGSLLLTGCGLFTSRETPDAPSDPVQTYSGPRLFHTTVGSMATMRGYLPTLVSGYGLVVNLENTGSSECPPSLREWMLNEMGKQGFGRPSLGFGSMTPEQVLDSNRTAVVLIQGVMPPGATHGTRFDLLVSALPGTQTKSLQDGVLYTLDLFNGLVTLEPPLGQPVAHGRGAITLNPNPSGHDESKEAASQRLRVGRVIAGGTTGENVTLSLTANQPSYRRVRDMADRINTRFPQTPEDKFPVAKAQNDTEIEINIPAKYKNDPQRLINLLESLYLNSSPAFIHKQGKQLAESLRQPAYRELADRVAYAWEAMGREVTEIIRPYYDDSDLVVRLAALQAGARLADPKTAEPLFAIADTGTVLAAECLGDLLVARPDHGRARLLLRRLLDHDKTEIRIHAYRALETAHDSSITAWVFKEGNQREKMAVSVVRCEKPLIWASQSSKPQIVMFGEQLHLNAPTLFSIWDNQLMLKTIPDNPSQIAIRYRNPLHPAAKEMTIANDAPLLAGTFAFRPDQDSKSDGLDMSYSRVVAALQHLSREGHIDAPFELETSDLSEKIEYILKLSDVAEMRKETDTPTLEKPAAGDNSGKPGFLPLPRQE